MPVVPNPDVRAVQVIPSVEVVIFPLLPVAIKVPFPYPTPLISVVLNPDVLDVQVIASVEVVNVPLSPTATYRPFP